MNISFFSLYRISTILVSFVFLASCKPIAKPEYSWLFQEIYPEKLNGNVKQIMIKGNFSNDLIKIEFNEKGELEQRIINRTNISLSESKSDTSILYDTTLYRFNYVKTGERKNIKEIGAGSHYLTGTKPQQYKDTVRWDFNKAGQIIQYTSNPGSEIGWLGECQYDTAGNIVKWKRWQRAIKLEPDCYTFKYNSRHQMIESSLNEDDFREVLIKKLYKYIAFDSHNNWIKRIEYSQSYEPMPKHSSIDTVTRKITYY